MKKLLLFLCLVPFLFGCASKKYTNQAVKFDEAGLYEDAAEYYYKAVKKKDSNVEAKLGLRKTGQLALDYKLQEVKNAYQRSDFKEAVYHFMDAESYQQKMKGVGVNLSFPEIYESYFEEAKSDYIGNRYAEAIDKLNREEFESAQKILIEIRRIDSDYKDVNDKFIVATYEPMYRQAAEYMNIEMYRKAYYTFQDIISGSGSYKQSMALKDEALEKGTLTILVDDFEYKQSNIQKLAERYTSQVKSSLSHTLNPFLKIIDPQLLNADIYNYGKLDIEAAKLAGIDAVLNGEVIKVSQKKGTLQKESKRGYTKEVTRYKNKDGTEKVDVHYNKITYQEYRVKNGVQMNISFQLVSTENGEIMVGDQWSLTNEDEAHYATFDGDSRKLIPGYWKSRSGRSDADIIKDNRSDVSRLNRLLKADRKIKTLSVLQNELINNIVSELTKKVDRYNPEE